VQQQSKLGWRELAQQGGGFTAACCSPAGCWWLAMEKGEGSGLGGEEVEDTAAATRRHFCGVHACVQRVKRRVRDVCVSVHACVQEVRER